MGKRFGQRPGGGRRAAQEEAQRPQIEYNTAAWTQEHDAQLLSLVTAEGRHRWAEVASALGSRNPNDVWARWYSRVDPQRPAGGPACHDGDGDEPPAKRLKQGGPGGGGPKSGTIRFPKKKFAMLIGFLGADYQGFQRNPGAKAVEDDIEAALYSAGAIMPSNHGDLRKIAWTRSARTDKGVSAACMCVGMRMAMVRPADQMLAAIRRHLPEHVALHALVPTVAGFDAKNQCSKRRYEYLLPTYALLPRGSKLNADTVLPPTLLSPMLTTLRQQLQCYVGTHSFHNFQGAKLKSGDTKAQRYILSFEASDAISIDGMQLIRCTVLGQSFLMHQIRKMIGLAVMVTSERAPADAITQALRLDVSLPAPMAPGLGLLLDETIFDQYNNMNEEKKRVQPGAEPHVHINRAACGEGGVDAFKRDVIYPKIVAGERTERPFATFLELADVRRVDYRGALVSAPATAPAVASATTSQPAPASSVSSATATGMTAATAAAVAAIPAAGGQLYQLILCNPGSGSFSGAKIVKLGPLSTLAELTAAIRAKLGPAVFPPEQELVLSAGGVAVADEASFQAMPTRGKVDVSIAPSGS